MKVAAVERVSVAVPLGVVGGGEGVQVGDEVEAVDFGVGGRRSGAVRLGSCPTSRNPRE